MDHNINSWYHKLILFLLFHLCFTYCMNFSYNRDARVTHPGCHIQSSTKVQDPESGGGWGRGWATQSGNDHPPCTAEPLRLSLLGLCPRVNTAASPAPTAQCLSHQSRREGRRVGSGHTLFGESRSGGRHQAVLCPGAASGRRGGALASFQRATSTVLASCTRLTSRSLATSEL